MNNDEQSKTEEGQSCLTVGLGVITHGGVARGFKFCLCSICKATRKCVPEFDFYTEPNDDNGPLICESCFRHKIHNKCTSNVYSAPEKQ